MIDKIETLAYNQSLFRIRQDTQDANIQNLNQSLVTQATNIQNLNQSLVTQATNIQNLNQSLVNLTAGVGVIRDFGNQLGDKFTAFSMLTTDELARLKSVDMAFKSDMAAMKKQIDSINNDLAVMHNNYNGLLISWIVSIIVIAFIFIGLFYYVWKKGQQQTDINEGIPLRPARGYSYT